MMLELAMTMTRIPLEATEHIDTRTYLLNLGAS